jgi:hypothetical protein
MTVRDESLWRDEAADRMGAVLKELGQDDVDWTNALKLTKEAREELGMYDLDKVPGEPQVDRLDRVLNLLRFLQNEVEYKNHQNRTRAKHYAESVLDVLNSAQ